MKLISDIRLFQGYVENIDGNSLPQYLGNKNLEATAKRIAMKLREQKVSLGEFDHLYLNFTTCKVDGIIAPAKRSRDPYHPWYRYCDIQVTEEELSALVQETQTEKFLEYAGRALKI